MAIVPGGRPLLDAIVRQRGVSSAGRGLRYGKADNLGPSPAEVDPQLPSRGWEAYDPEQMEAVRNMWQIALGEGATEQRLATRGELAVRGDKRYYRRKSDGMLIPIDEQGNVIRRGGPSSGGGMYR